MKKLLLVLATVFLGPAITFANGNHEHMGDWGHMKDTTFTALPQNKITILFRNFCPVFVKSYVLDLHFQI